MALASLQPEGGAPNEREYWHVHGTECGAGGDLCLVKGCAAKSFEIVVGHNSNNYGMRRDDHDAVGVVLSLPIAPEQKVSLPFIPLKKPSAAPESIGEVPSTVGDAAAERMDEELSDKETAKTSADHGTETSKPEKHATFVDPEAG